MTLPGVRRRIRANLAERSGTTGGAFFDERRRADDRFRLRRADVRNGDRRRLRITGALADRRRLRNGGGLTNLRAARRLRRLRQTGNLANLRSVRSVGRDRLDDVFLFVRNRTPRGKGRRRRVIHRRTSVSDERLDVETAEREGRASLPRSLRTRGERKASAANRFLRKRFRRSVCRRSEAGRRFLTRRRRIVSFRVVGADRIGIRVVTVVIVVTVIGSAVTAGAGGRVAFFAATADEIAANVARIAVRLRRARRATAVRVDSFGQHRGGPMERSGRDVERAADDRGEVATRSAKTAVTVARAAVRFATDRGAASRRNVASRFASRRREFANRFASRGDRFANRRKFAVGRAGAVITVVTDLTERRRRAERRDRPDGQKALPIFFHCFLADKTGETRARAFRRRKAGAFNFANRFIDANGR